MTSFEALPKPNVPEEIVRKLLKLIEEKKLRAGAKLPPERELAAQLHVSRPSLREALRALSVMKVVEIRQGAGTYITQLEPDLLVEHLDFVFALSDTSYLDLLEARKIVEVGLCGLAAQRISAEEVSELETCLQQSVQMAPNSPLFFQADLDLHERITNAAHNLTLGHFMAGIQRLGKASRQRTTNLPGIRETVVADHHAIVKALSQHDPQAAQEAMLQHLNHIESNLRESINQDISATLESAEL